MDEKNYIVGAPVPSFMSVRYRCADCDAEVYLSPDGQARAMRHHIPLCVPCGFARAARDGEEIIPLPYDGPRP